VAKVLVLGGGGREHALAWKLAQSPEVEKVYVAPGNGGTALEFENVPIDPMDFKALADFVKGEGINLTVVGPEKPLAEGVVDYFNERGLRIFGPNRDAAQIEADKYFAKKLMLDAHIPTAFYVPARLDSIDVAIEAAYNFIEQFGGVVVKYPYLAAGKGVSVCRTRDEAEEAIKNIIDEKFGRTKVALLEEFLVGEEASFLAFVDGENVLPLLPAQDYKPVHDGDKGPNTGGMGAYAPVQFVDGEMQERIMNEIMRPIIKEMKEVGIEYKGVLYAGLMITKDGHPKVLEFNCRFGDPETQPLMMLLEFDLYKVMNATIDGKLNEIGELKFTPGYAVTVVIASQGYPGKYEKGKLITGLDNVSIEPTGSPVDRFRDVKVFHAGTKLGDDGSLYTNGGRVLGVTARAETLSMAQRIAYENVGKINFEGAFYRKDIAEGGRRR